MDSADSDPVCQALRAQGEKLSQQQEQLTSLCSNLREMAVRQDSMMSSLRSQFNEMFSKFARETSAAAGPIVNPPPGFFSSPCCNVLHARPPDQNIFQVKQVIFDLFLTQYKLHFELQATVFPTDWSKVAVVISHLTGHAEAWATAEWSSLFKLRQGKCKVSDYAIEFRTEATKSDWNQLPLIDAFLLRLLKTNLLLWIFQRIWILSPH